MKIAVVASPVTPLRPAQLGGAQAFVSDLALGLVRRDHDVRLFCAEGSDVAGVTLVTVPAPADADAALVMPGGPPPPAAPGVEAAFRALFERIHEWKPNAISQHAFDAPAFELAQSLPVLHTLHLPPLVPAVVQAAAAVPPASLATVSRSCRDAWNVAGIGISRVLYNGVPDVPPDDAPNARHALIAGRLSPEKGVEHAIAAAKEARLPVVVAGAHYDPAYAVDLGEVRYMGSLPRAELWRLMARSAVTVCAVRWEEPFGMVAAEAQMAGCPVAAYRSGAMPEVIEEGVSGFLAGPDDIHELAAAIKRCTGLDREAVRASARRRLGLEPALQRYEAALLGVAR